MRSVLPTLAYLFLITIPCQAQDFEVSFSGGEAVIDSLTASNLATGDSVKMTGDAILLLRNRTTGIQAIPDDGDKLSIIYSADQKIKVNYSISEQQKIIIRLSDISGRILVQKGYEVYGGVNQFDISASQGGLHIISILKGNAQYSIKGVFTGAGRNEISYSGNSLIPANKSEHVQKGLQTDTFVLLYTPGDIISYTFHSGDRITIINEEACTSEVLGPEFHACVDYEGNSHSVVKIGNQWWMAENLRSTRYADGREILLLEDSDFWPHLLTTEKAYCYYNNEESRGYGPLYTFMAAVNGTPYGSVPVVQGVCPDGWRVPANEDWSELKNFLIAGHYNWDGTTTGNKIASSLASNHGWIRNTVVEGSPGNDEASNNRTGFNGKPGGHITPTGLFRDEGDGAFWWSSNEYSDNESYSWMILNSMDSLYHVRNMKTSGYSVRCIKNPSDPYSASFSADITTVSLGEEIRFTDLSSGEPDYWVWSFGDNNYSFEQNPVHLYSSPGTYTVHLSVGSYDFSGYETKTDYITVTESTKRSVTDTEDNFYKAVKIGNQLWMAENLKSTRYSSGDAIPLVTSDSEWGSLAADNSAKAYCFYNNDTNSEFGALYTYAAAVNGTPYDGTGNMQGICPAGWHIPAEAEWNTMENYLIANGYNYDGSLTGNKIGKSVASTSGWTVSEAEGSVGFNQTSNNSSGFNGLPGGYRSYYSTTGEFENAGDGAYWWMSNEVFAETAMYWNIYFIYRHVLRDYTFKRTGLSVRCLKDDDGSPLADFTSDVKEVKLGKTVNFTDLSFNSPDSLVWDFDSPGEGSSEQNPSHTFTRKGPQRVTLIAFNEHGYDVESKTDYVNVTQRNSLVNDIDGNIYRTVEIGDQWWMAENLKTTRYNDGTNINLMTKALASGETSSPAYCWYADDEATYGETYGALYNWFAVNTGKLCPAGWHVPTQDDWHILERAMNTYIDETDSTLYLYPNTGSKLAGNADLWVSHIDSTYMVSLKNNLHFGSSGFIALPGGSASQDCDYNRVNYNGFWWSSTEFDIYHARIRIINSVTSDFGKLSYAKNQFLSVRCLMD